MLAARVASRRQGGKGWEGEGKKRLQHSREWETTGKHRGRYRKGPQIVVM